VPQPCTGRLERKDSEDIAARSVAGEILARANFFRW